MPTTLSEMEKIRCIILTYVDSRTAKKLADELYDEVGRTTTNRSLAVTLGMLVGAFEDQ